MTWSRALRKCLAYLTAFSLVFCQSVVVPGSATAAPTPTSDAAYRAEADALAVKFPSLRQIREGLDASAFDPAAMAGIATSAFRGDAPAGLAAARGRNP